MACGIAMKRPHDLDPLINAEPSVKRSRTWMSSPQSHCGSPQQAFQQRSPNHSVYSNANIHGSAVPSHLDNLTDREPKAELDELDMRLLLEIQKFRQHRRLPMMRGNESPSSSHSDSDTDQRMESSSPSMGKLGAVIDASHAASAIRSERPMFSYKQMRLLCERLLKEQELRLREEYDQTLNAKLTEQYETFVRFTYDQIHRRLDDTPMSYLS